MKRENNMNELALQRYVPTENIVEVAAESDQAEPLVLSLSPCFEEADGLYRQIKEKELEVEDMISAYRWRLRKELGVTDLNSQWSKKLKEADEQTLESWKQIAQDAYDGKNGRGVLAIAGNSNQIRLIRAVPILDPQNMKYQNDRDDWQNKKLIYDGNLLYPSKFSDMNNFGNNLPSSQEHLFFAEVAREATTSQEYQEYYQLLLAQGYTVPALIELFPKEFMPTFEVGQKVGYSGSSHHSGSIEGYGIVLPTGRMAIVSEYSGELTSKGQLKYDEGTRSFKKELEQKYHLWGVTENPRFIPDWSAKYADLENKDELKKPTTGELGFLLNGMYLDEMSELSEPECDELRTLTATDNVEGENDEDKTEQRAQSIREELAYLSEEADEAVWGASSQSPESIFERSGELSAELTGLEKTNQESKTELDPTKLESIVGQDNK